MSRSRLSAKERLSMLRALRNSCLEGYDGRWDCSSAEGREGFLLMAEDVDQLIWEAKLDAWKEQRNKREGGK